MPHDTLADQALKQLSGILEKNGSSLSGPGHTAIGALLSALEAGLKNQLPPQYLLSSIDPGMGKTLSVAQFLRAWKAAGFVPASSVLVGVSRLEEIRTYLSHSGLTGQDVGVLTADPVMNALGVPVEEHGAARVLFTSQQMIASRTRGKSFSEATDFHYAGTPRPLRIWDESFDPAEPVTMRVDDLAGLLAPLRGRHTKLADEVKSLVQDAWGLADGQALTISEGLAYRARVAGTGGLVSEAVKTVRNLARLGSQKLRLVEQHQAGTVLAGSAPSIPDDFAPAVIIDASGRVRETYRLWESHRGTLVRLPAAANDYRNLSIHLWERAAGRSALRNPKDRKNIAAAIADAANANVASQWVVVHTKESVALMDEVATLVDGEPSRVRSLTWGEHRGTNRFVDVGNIVIVSDYAYNTPAYHAIGAAASGGAATALTPRNINDIKRGEFQHNLLQAVCRAAVRRSRDGVTGPCNAFVIVPPAQELEDTISATFPGCSIMPWVPAAKELRGHVLEATNYITDRLNAGGYQPVQKKDIRLHLGLTAPNFSQNVLAHTDFADFLRRNGLVITSRTVERMFTPYSIPDAYSCTDEGQQ